MKATEQFCGPVYDIYYTAQWLHKVVLAFEYVRKAMVRLLRKKNLFSNDNFAQTEFFSVFSQNEIGRGRWKG